MHASSTRVEIQSNCRPAEHSKKTFSRKKSHELIKMPTDGVSMKLVRKLHNLPCVIQPLAANVDKPVTVAYIGLGLDCKR